MEMIPAVSFFVRQTSSPIGEKVETIRTNIFIKKIGGSDR